MQFNQLMFSTSTSIENNMNYYLLNKQKISRLFSFLFILFGKKSQFLKPKFCQIFFFNVKWNKLGKYHFVYPLPRPIRKQNSEKRSMQIHSLILLFLPVSNDIYRNCFVVFYFFFFFSTRISNSLY